MSTAQPPEGTPMIDSMSAAFAVLSPVIGLWRKFTTAPRFAAGSRPSRDDAWRDRRASAPVELSCRPKVAALPRARTRASTPLRVLRVVDAGLPAHGGRMVISGRMADVCAELDRMVERETALSIGA